MKRLVLIVGAGALLALGLGTVLLRQRLAGEATEAYFRQHGIASEIKIGTLNFSGLTGRVALGPASAPDFAARVELGFDRRFWIPRVIEVHLTDAVVRARLTSDGRVVLPALQDWIESLARGGGRSRFVSEDLSVTLSDARLLLATGGGTVEMIGDARLLKNKPQSLRLRVLPCIIAIQGTTLRVAAANLRLDALGNGYGLSAHVAGDIAAKNFSLRGMAADLVAQHLRLSAQGVGVDTAVASLSFGHVQTGGVALAPLDLVLTARNARGTYHGDAAATLTWTAQATVGSNLLTRYPELKSDPVLANTLGANLARVTLTGSADIGRKDGVWNVRLTAPATLSGTKGGALRLSALTFSGTEKAWRAKLAADLSGPGLPRLTFASGNLTADADGVSGDADLGARLDLFSLKGLAGTLHGRLNYRHGRFAFALSRCAHLTLAAMATMARDASATLCPAAAPLFAWNAQGWRAEGLARNTDIFLPAADAQLRNASGHFVFTASTGKVLAGDVAIASITLADRAKMLRFHPLQGVGQIHAAGGVWSGRFKVADAENHALGDVTFRHVLASGSGEATIAAPHLTFATNGLQPAGLSPLLVKLVRADGEVDFSGHLAWTRKGFTSDGKLAIAKLDFQTPLGRAHALSTRIVFSSLLPPVTAGGQGLKIAKIDWALPLGATEINFAFSPGAISILGARAGIATGTIAVDRFALNPGGPTASTLRLDKIDLAPVVAAFNLGGKVKLTGIVSGSLPFSFGPEGFHIHDGRIAALGPGRLSVDRSVWGASGQNANAVQDFAYQALENLAFDQMSAQIDSIAGGRLQIVFHIKGKSDPPKPQTADLAIIDLLNGTSFQKPIPLPSATPVDLTLDLSLNFDELLKSYAQAWSNQLGRAEGNPP